MTVLFHLILGVHSRFTGKLKERELSKFIDDLDARITGERASVPWDFSVTVVPVNSEVDTVVTFPGVKEYEISTSYTVRVAVEPKDLKYALENAAENIKCHIYGDLRLLLLSLERAIFNRDREEWEKIMRDLKREVF